MTPEAKKIFVDRMWASRKKKLEDKIRIEILEEAPTHAVTKVKSVENKVAKAVVAPQPTIVTQTPTIREPVDYSHYNILSENINRLNDTLSALSRPPPPPPKAIAKVAEVASPQPKAIVEVASPPPQPKAAEPISIPVAKPEKEEVWNCRRKCYVYM